MFGSGSAGCLASGGAVRLPEISSWLEWGTGEERSLGDKPQRHSTLVPSIPCVRLADDRMVICRVSQCPPEMNGQW
jgi:hypothetical protein